MYAFAYQRPGSVAEALAQQGHAFDVHLRLVVRRHAVVLAHGGFAGVVRRRGEADVAAEIAQQHDLPVRANFQFLGLDSFSA